MDYANLKWPQLIKVANEKGVYSQGMTKIEVLEALDNLDEEEVPTQGEVETPDEEENATEASSEAPTQEGDDDGVEVEDADETMEGKVVFEAVEDRDGKIIPLEVSINREKWIGVRIVVPEELSEEIRRLLKAGRYLFIESK